MLAAIALIEMAAERGRTAAHDGVEDLDLLPAQRLSIAI
jgi:hypothetical protein